MTEIKLYPHNQETYNKIQEMWKTTNRVAAVQATGTGKSFLILKCLFDIPNENKVVLAPTEYIFGQLIEHSEEPIPNVQFITYTKIAIMTDEEIKALKPSLIVLDEFHRCGAEQWGKGVQKLLEIYSDVKILGTSATPIRYLDNERNMGDEIFEGNLAVNLSLAEAIVKNILPIPKYVSALYTFDEEVNNLRDKVNKSHNSDEEKEELLKQIGVMRNKLDRSKGIPKILQKYLIQHNCKFIVFCKNKEHLNEMKTTVVNWFKSANIGNKIETYTVYTGYENIKSEFEAFRDNKNEDSLKLLFSIEMLNEGVHVEDVTGVILLRPTTSPIIYYQQIGRAIDAGSDKEPLIFDFVNNFDNIGAKKFIEDLNEFKQKEIYARKEYEDRDDVSIPKFFVYDEIQEVKNLFNNIEDRLIDNWGIMYNQLLKYYLQNGNTKVNRNEKSFLNLWLTAQRKEYSNNALSFEKIAKLNKLEFSWKVYDQWEEIFTLLKKYQEEHGNCLIAQSKIYKDVQLGRWVNSQRQKYKTKKLSQDKIDKLTSVGFMWNTIEPKWYDIFMHILQFKDNNGVCIIPKDYKTDSGINLYTWFNNQKQFYKLNKLDSDKLSKFNEFGIILKKV